MTDAAAEGTPTELRRLLLESAVVPAEQIDAWGHLPMSMPAPQELVLSTAEHLVSAVRSGCAPLVQYAVLGDAPWASTGVERAALPCMQLAALEAVLARAGTETAGACALQIFSRLEAASEALAAHAAAQLLWPKQWSGGRIEDVPLRAQALRLPLLVLVRCVGVEAFSARELLGLTGSDCNDIATAVAIAVASMKQPGTPPLPQLRARLWQVLYHLTTPQCAAEQARQADDGVRNNDTPMEELLVEHVAHAHRIAFCFAQFGVLAAACECAEDTQHRGAVLVACLGTIQNLVASPHLWSPGRLLARQLTVLWPRFGFKLLAPHLRRLLSNSESGATTAVRAARELRRDLRTLGWVLHHSPELRQYAAPLCAELAMKAARGNHPAKTLAVAVGAAANAGALQEAGPLRRTLEAVEDRRKSAVREAFPSETTRLWIIEEAWGIVEELGYWPVALVLEEDDAVAGREAELAAISKLHPLAGAWQFDFLADPVFEGGEPNAESDVFGEDWDPEQAYGDDDADDDWTWGPQYAEAIGPLGILNVPAPPLPLSTDGRRTATVLLCEAPDAFRCAISGQLCCDPVRTPGGILYERSSIAAWLSWNKVCPVTGVPLLHTELVGDTSVSAAVAAWLSGAG